MRRVTESSRGFSAALRRYRRVGGAPADPVAAYGYDFSVHDLRIDEEVVCPRCLAWIAPHEIVRRTAYGPAQHEACLRPTS